MDRDLVGVALSGVTPFGDKRFGRAPAIVYLAERCGLGQSVNVGGSGSDQYNLVLISRVDCCCDLPPLGFALKHARIGARPVQLRLRRAILQSVLGLLASLPDNLLHHLPSNLLVRELATAIGAGRTI